MKRNMHINKRDIALICIGIAIIAAIVFGFAILYVKKTLFVELTIYIILTIGLGIIFLYLIIKWVIPAMKLNSLMDKANEKEDISDLLIESDGSGKLSYVDKIIEGISDLISREQRAHLLSTETTIHMLQSQINPHFLYNTLESIRSKAILQGNEEIAEMTEALARLFRYNISRPGEMVTFAEEMENVESYLTIQQYRFRDKFKFKKIYDESDEYLMIYMMPILTIQPIVENAIHHGLENKVGEGEITIRAFTTQDRLIITVSDDGIGIPEKELQKMRQKLTKINGFTDISEKNQKKRGEGIALRNVMQRIKFYYGDEYGLEITSVEGVGTTVEIELPKIYDFKRNRIDA